MRIDVWGNVFLYCQKKEIDFCDVVLGKLEEDISKKYKIAEKVNNKWNMPSCISTMESDISVLVNEAKIPLQEIFFPECRDKQIVKLCKDKWFFGNVTFTKTEEGVLWSASTSLMDGDGIRFLLTMNKYLDLQSMSINYWIDAVYFSARCVLKKKTKLKYNISLFSNDSYGKAFMIYQGDSGVVPEYIDSYIANETWHDDDGNKVDKTQYNIIDFKDIVIKSSLRKCSKENHATCVVNGIIFIIENKTYNIVNKVVPLLYCKDCNVYYMYEDVYNSLRLIGRPLIRTTDTVHANDMRNFMHLNKESKFNLCGYTVNATDDIPDTSRHQLLDFIIKRNIVNLTETINYLSWLINTRANEHCMKNAVIKWKNDLAYIYEQYANENQSIIVRKVRE